MKTLARDTLDELARPILQDFGLKLYGHEYAARHLLRIYLDKEEGKITLEDCAKVSHELVNILRVQGLVDDRCHLEVSSPGVERPLLTIEHYKACEGQQVRIKLHKNAGLELGKYVTGLLKLVESDGIVLQIEPQGVEKSIRFDFIARGNAVNYLAGLS